MSSRRLDNIPVNNALINVITPMEMEFKRNSLIIGESVGRMYGVIRFPPIVNFGWLSKVCNIPGTISAITFTPADSSELVDSISRNVQLNRGVAESAKEPITRQRAERGAEDGERLMAQIDQRGEAVGYMSVLIMTLARTDEEFEQTCRRIDSTFSSIGCKVRALANLQREAFKAISPYYAQDETMNSILRRIVPLSTFIGGFPFSAMGCADPTGFYLAKDVYGGIIVTDLWKRGGDRTNSNMVIMGIAGMGKSASIKSIILSEYARGTKLVLVDPEREYKSICEELKGDWINLGGCRADHAQRAEEGSEASVSVRQTRAQAKREPTANRGGGGRINPLQVRPVPKDDDADDDENGMGDLAQYLNHLYTFFTIYLPKLTEIQFSLLKATLEELYASFGITWNTDVSKLDNTQFPIFSDLYNLLKKNAVGKAEGSPERVLAALLRDIAVGCDSFIWNGHTTLEPKSRCICLDTHDLQNASEIVRRTQYFNSLTWCWEQMSRNRDERVLLICDEAYLLIDPNVPQSLVFLRNAAKRARKYESGIVIISHSAADFLEPAIKMYGQALLDIPAYKLMFGTDGRNLRETAELYGLTDAEQELLASKQRGHALLMIGSKRLHAKFELPEYKLDIINRSGGGR